MDTQGQQVINIELPASVDHVDQTIITVRNVLDDVLPGYDDFSIELVLREALMNAVKHGNKYDADKKVGLNISWDAHYFLIRISDEGQGFTYKPSSPDELDHSAESGRGLPIIEYYAEALSFNEVGNKIELKISIYKSADNS